MFLIGVDLGRRVDYATITIAQDRLVQKAVTIHELQGLPRGVRAAFEEVPSLLVRRYEIQHLEELPHVSYPMIARRIYTIASNPVISRDFLLVIDATGVGIAVMDLLRDPPYFLNPMGIAVAPGHSVTQTDLGYNVAKLFIVNNMQVLFQEGRILVAAGLKHADTFRDQLRTFTAKVTPTGQETFAAEHESDHDDFVMGAGILFWVAEKFFAHVIQLPRGGDPNRKPYDPARTGIS